MNIKTILKELKAGLYQMEADKYPTSIRDAVKIVIAILETVLNKTGDIK